MLRKFHNCLLIILCLSGSDAQSYAAPPPRIALLGHTYPLEEIEGAMDTLFSKVNEQKPNAVIVLGDAHLNREGRVNRFKNSLDAPVFFTPGNHDLEDGNKPYASFLEKVGYLEKFVQTPFADLILMNTLQSASKTLLFLNRLKPKLSQSKPTLLLGHHPVWDDKRISPKEYSHDKPFYFKELFPFVGEYIDSIYAGNSPSFYFGWEGSFVAYWSEIRSQIPCYNVGMGLGRPQATFVILEFEGNSIRVNPIGFETNSSPPSENLPEAPSLLHRILRTAKDLKLWLGFILGGLSVVSLLRLRNPKNY